MSPVSNTKSQSPMVARRSNTSSPTPSSVTSTNNSHKTSPISCNGILFPPTIQQLKNKTPIILEKSNTPKRLKVNSESVTDSSRAKFMQEQINAHPFDSVFDLESFQSDFEYRNLLNEAWNGKNVAFVFHGASTETRRRKILLSTDFASTSAGSAQPKSPSSHDSSSSMPFILRICETILKQLKLKSDKFSSSRYKMEISMMELYNNNVYDVLYPMNPENGLKSGASASGLNIHSHAKYGSYCPSCANFRVRSMMEVRKLLELGMKERPSRKLLGQENSSLESATWEDALAAPPLTHLLFQIVLTQTNFDFSKTKPATEIISKITIADIAGDIVQPSKASSVSVPSTSSNQSSVNAWLEQSNNILSTVVQRLVNKRDENITSQSKQNSNGSDYLPYRDSNLTLLLKDQLGGNCVTSFVLCMAATTDEEEQIASTLAMAAKLSRIHNHPTLNRYKNDAIDSEIEDHILHLEDQLSSTIVYDDKYKSLKDELEDEKELLQVIRKSPKDRMAHFARKRKTNVSDMLKSGVSISAIGDVLEYDTSAVPYLLNMKSYISTFEKLVFFLTQTHVTVGTASDNDICLGGNGMKLHHAVFRKEVNNSDEEQVVVEPLQDSVLYVNGEQVEESKVVRTGDRIILGEHILQYAHPRFPMDAQREKELLFGESGLSEPRQSSPSSAGTDEIPSSIVGWERAKRELIVKRTAALEEEAKKREGTIQKLVEQILSKEDELKSVEDKIVKAQVELESTEKIVEERSESTKSLQTKTKKYQKHFSNIKSQEGVLLKEIEEHKEELKKLEESLRVTRKENRKEQELKNQIATEIALMKQEKKSAIDARYEFLKAKEHHEQQMQKSKELELEVRDKSLALTQKILDIREKNIIIRQKNIEIQQKDIAVREREVAIEEKTHTIAELDQLIQTRTRENERIQDELTRYSSQFQEFLEYKEQQQNKSRRGCLPFRRKKKVSHEEIAVRTPSANSDRKSSTTFKSTIVNARS